MRRLGSTRDQRINVRIVAATHRCMETLTREGKFRSDLYFRLRIVQLDVPPLRERGDDTLYLARHFLGLHAARYGRNSMVFDESAEQMLRRHRWPGNVRELRNIVEQAVLLAQSDTIEGSHLNLCSPLVFREEAPAAVALDSAIQFPSEGVQLANVERDLLMRALTHTDWNVTQAARLLGLSRDTMRYRIDKFGLKQPATSAPQAEA
jgi:DNA-binding NtrC family response regulator